MKVLLRAGGILLLVAMVASGAFYWNPLWVNDQQIRYGLWRSHVHSEYVDAGGIACTTSKRRPRMERQAYLWC